MDYPQQARRRTATAYDSPHPEPTALAHALGFTAQDLEANRLGALTERQAERIRREAAVRVAQAAAVCLPTFVILTLLFNTAAIDGVLWALILAGVPFVTHAVILWPAIQDANALRVRAVSGRVIPERWQPTFWARGGWLFRLRPGYYYRIESERFRVSREAFLALAPGAYTLYVTPNARRLVSAEASRSTSDREYT